MKYLVTGGAGFIGSHIVERLLKEGHFVRVLDNFSSGKEENLSFALKKGLSSCRKQDTRRSDKAGCLNFDLIKGDICDKDTCNRACNGIDYLLHQAALRSVPKSMEHPEDYNEVNINGTLNMLRAGLENKVKRFVFASSSSIYGEAVNFPQKESDPPLLISPYALTKLSGEYYCRVFSQNYGLQTVSLRYFNVFGPRQALDDEYAVVIPKFIHCILNDQNPPIHGTGKQSRDFTYIDNVVEANILAATTLNTHYSILNTERSDFCEVFNVACGKDQTILELVNVINKITSKSIKPIFTPPRQGDVFRTFADITKIKKALGYAPKVDFEEGLRRTVDYFRKSI